jgi:hypothetical protein
MAGDQIQSNCRHDHLVFPRKPFLRLNSDIGWLLDEFHKMVDILRTEDIFLKTEMKKSIFALKPIFKRQITLYLLRLDLL